MPRTLLDNASLPGWVLSLSFWDPRGLGFVLTDFPAWCMLLRWVKGRLAMRHPCTTGLSIRPHRLESPVNTPSRRVPACPGCAVWSTARNTSFFKNQDSFASTTAHMLTKCARICRPVWSVTLRDVCPPFMHKGLLVPG